MQFRTILVLKLIPDKGSSKALPLFIAIQGIRNNFLVHLHGEEHVKKLFSTAVIVNEDTH